jgi:transcriptional regulator with XRE-family HTH domain
MAHGSTHDELRRQFAERLRAAIERKGWSQAQTLREARRFLEAGEKLASAHLSHYVHGRVIPGMTYLLALSRALEVSVQDLLGGSGLRLVDKSVASQQREADAHHSAQVRDADQGEAWLTIDERVPWQTAVKILELLKMGGRLPASASRAPSPALQPRAVALVEA